MTTQTQIQDPSVYDLPTLVKWYIDLRASKSEIKRSIEPALAQVDMQMEEIEKEFHKRCMEGGTLSMKTEYGTISRVVKSKYLISDGHDFREWLKKNPEDGAGLVSGITQGEVKAYVEAGNELPDGITMDSFYDISVRRA